MNSSEIKIIADSIIERIRINTKTLARLQEVCQHDTTETMPNYKDGTWCTACRKVLTNESSGW